MKSVIDLISNDQIVDIYKCPLQGNLRHPTWYPVFHSNRPIDYQSNAAVNMIANHGDKNWLKKLGSRLADTSNFEDAAAALAELRVYGAFMEAGFEIAPIFTAAQPTEDFEVKIRGKSFVVEVFAKHQDGKQKKKTIAVSKGQVFPDVERKVQKLRQGTITTTISQIYPGGEPDYTKAGDSVQANVISRLCSVKQDEKQLPSDKPALLWIDLTNFGACPELLDLSQASPVEYFKGLTSGAFWYAFYGWKDAPIFEAEYPKSRTYKMGHDGRFRMKTKLSGVFLSCHDGCLFFENPWAKQRIYNDARARFLLLPKFSLMASICDWKKGDAGRSVKRSENSIQALCGWNQKL